LPECLEALEDEPGPWAVFEPLVARDLVEVKAKGPAWWARFEGLKLPQSEIGLGDCIVNFVSMRFPKLSFEEVLAMFQLTPLEQTRVGQQRLQQGLSKGLSKGLEQGREEGEIIGRIRTYQELLGQEMAPVETLAEKSLRSIKGMATRLRKRLGQEVGTLRRT